MDNHREQMKAVDFCCGAGGMTYGLCEVGINVLAGIDNDENCKETYEYNNPNSKFFKANLTTFKEEKLANDVGIQKNDDSMIFIMCSPCQYWTKISTDREKSCETKDLLEEFQRFVSWFRPGFIVIENVPGLLKRSDESGLTNFLAFLANNEYVYEHGIISSNYYGVPQSRKRYLLVGTRLAETITLPEKENNEEFTVRNFIGEDNGFYPIEDGHLDETDFMHTTAKLSEKNRIRIRKVPPNGGTRLSWKDDPELQIDAYKNKDHIFVNVYGRMFWDKPAPTITTRFNSLSNGRFGHPTEHRAISLREGATFQTFPMDYVFKAKSIAAITSQIGNAVPPELAKRIGITILRSFNNASFSCESTCC